MRRILSTSVLFLSASLATIACSDPVTPPGGTGGTASGGAGSGGAPASTGGAVGSGGVVGSGGAGSGGAPSTGGASSGGASSGGAASGGASSGGAASGGAGSGGEAGGDFTVTSTAFADGEEIPAAHTCEGGGGQNNWGAAPDLKWENAPEGTMSFAFFMIDETLTTKEPPDVNGNHSGAWNIPTTVTELPLGWGTADLDGATAINGGYLGPCPNLVTQGNTDTYNLIVLALPMASYTITASGTAGVRDAYAQLKEEALAEAILSGTSDAVM